jgi:hypothetical protein
MPLFPPHEKHQDPKQRGTLHAVIRTATNAPGKKAGKHRLENNTRNCFPFKVIKNYNHHCMNVIDTSIRDNPGAIYTKFFRTKKIRSVAKINKYNYRHKL